MQNIENSVVASFGLTTMGKFARLLVASSAVRPSGSKRRAGEDHNHTQRPYESLHNLFCLKIVYDACP